MNCNTLLSQNLSATKIAQAANMHFYSHFIILSFYSTPELQQVLSRQHSFSSVMNSFPSGIGYGQMNFTRAVPQEGVGLPRLALCEEAAPDERSQLARTEPRARASGTAPHGGFQLCCWETQPDGGEHYLPPAPNQPSLHKHSFPLQCSSRDC